jgi:hypothetical protein
VLWLANDPGKRPLHAVASLLVAGGELIEWGDWGLACVMAFAYRHPRTSEVVTVEQAVRVPYSAGWKPRFGPGQILCWGVLRSGLLR